MEKDLLELNMQDITVYKGMVEFSQYEQLKAQALELAEMMATVEINDETIKESKKLLAAVNKKVKELEDRRITIKKFVLEPYTAFETQVKEIVGIVKEADEYLRQQVRQMEEMERSEKESILKSIFVKRKEMYSLADLLKFNDFLQPKHLNKTVTIDAVEKEMVEFLEATEKAYSVLNNMPDPLDHIYAYMETFDVAEAIGKVQKQKQHRERIQHIQKGMDNPPTTMKTFTVFDQKDFLLVEMYMKNNKIKFTVKDEF